MTEKDPSGIPPTEPPKSMPSSQATPPNDPEGNENSGKLADPLKIGIGSPSAPTRHDQMSNVPGADLVMDFSQGGVAGQSSARQYSYWIGLMPDAPVESVTIAGNSWPKITKVRRLNPDRSGDDVFVPVIGALVRFDERTIRLIMAKLPWIVIRFRGDPGSLEEEGTGQNIADVARQPSNGTIITAKPPEEIQALRDAGRPAFEYRYSEGDHPAARYLFAELCPNQDAPSRGEYYPKVLEVTGLNWPGDLEPVVAS